jgi:deferrochelatase/peroxidase EfeB
MCVGRWKSGTPISRAPHEDNAEIAEDKFAPQSFFFDSDTRPVKWKDPDQKPDAFPAARMDGDGLVCPLAAHIRKVNPRDDGTDIGGSARSLRRRILRRGVTYGPAYRPGEKRRVDRGLLFLCYQRSISEQFEFIWRVWANKTDTPRALAGIDPIIGQNGDGKPADRKMNIVIAHDRSVPVSVTERFIITTGAAYLFAPSIAAITDTLAKV